MSDEHSPAYLRAREKHRAQKAVPVEKQPGPAPRRTWREVGALNGPRCTIVFSFKLAASEENPSPDALQAFLGPALDKLDGQNTSGTYLAHVERVDLAGNWSLTGVSKLS